MKNIIWISTILLIFAACSNSESNRTPAEQQEIKQEQHDLQLQQNQQQR